MTSETSFKVDFVAKGERPGEWRLILVEEGPWKDGIDQNLRRVQGRLYNCIDAAIDGQITERFPASTPQRIVIELECFNVPREPVTDFFERFSSGVLETPDYQKALQQSRFVDEIAFALRVRTT